MLHCYNCGADMPDNMLYCTRCGKKLADSETQTQVLGDAAAPTVAFGAPGTQPVTQGVVVQKKRGGGLKAVVITLVSLGLIGAIAVVLGAMYFMFNKRQTVAVNVAPNANAANRVANVADVNVNASSIGDNTNALIDNAMKQIQKAANDALAAANQASNITIPTVGKTLDGKTTRLTFRPGGTSATAVGTVESDASFVLRAKAGQTLSARITSPGGCIKFEDSDTNAVEIETDAGDNYLNVTNSCDKPASMVLSVSIK